MSTEKATLLFVDDEENVLRSLERIFRSQYKVLTARCGEDALALLKEQRIHVIISDQRMPTITGVEVLREAKEISPYTMRLLLTGYSDMEAIINSVNEGEIFRFISKPWEPDDIHSIVDRAADISQSLFESIEEIDNQLEMAMAKSKAEGNQVGGILLIDDDHAIFELISSAINDEFEERFQIFRSKSLNRAFEILSTEQIAVVVTEIELDGEDISAAIATIKQFHPNILTIVLTSHRDNTTLVDLINQSQIYRFLPKPASRVLLAKSLSAAIKQHRILNESPQLSSKYEVAKGHGEERNFSERIREFIAQFS